MIPFFLRMTDEKICKRLGNIAYIRNGMGYGFISDKFLYDNGYLEVGLGRVTSGRGDWGGGFEYAADSPLKIVIDKHYNIIKTETASFYNSRKSEAVEREAKKLIKWLGNKFIVKKPLLRECIDTLFASMPTERHIGLDVNLNSEVHTRNMLRYFTT